MGRANIVLGDDNGKIAQVATSSCHREIPHVMNPIRVSETSDSLHILIGRLRMQLKRRGVDGMSKFIRNFKIADKNASGTVDVEELKRWLDMCDMKFKSSEVEQLFSHFDVDDSGCLSYGEFLVGIRGEMNLNRSQTVLFAFSSLDIYKTGCIKLDDVAQKYNAKSNAAVLAGIK